MEKRIIVLGGGTMGRGIGLLCAQKGYATWIYDISETALQTAREYIERFTLKSIEKGKINSRSSGNALGSVALFYKLRSRFRSIHGH